MNKGFTIEQVKTVEDLIKHFDTYLPYQSNVQRDLLFKKVENTRDTFGDTLLAIYNKARKHKPELYKAVIAYGRKLYAR